MGKGVRYYLGISVFVIVIFYSIILYGFSESFVNANREK
jgi:hypothetical protein